MLTDSERFAFTPRRIHGFASTGNAYDATQTDDRIASGDTLLILPEGVVGVAHCWPFAVTQVTGKLHGVQPKAHETLAISPPPSTSAPTTSRPPSRWPKRSASPSIPHWPRSPRLRPEPHHRRTIMLTTATPAGADARLEQIARLNDRTRLGLDRTARVVITRNCLARLAEAEGAPKSLSSCKPA
jgi:hypothetical protein